MKQIESRDNPRFKELRRWATQGRVRRQSGVMLLEGLHLITALLDSGGSLLEVIVSVSGASRPENAAWLASHADVRKTCFPDRLFDELAATETPSGIMALARLPARLDDPDLSADCIVLDGVQDPGNVGTLLRTAAAAGVRQAMLGRGCADPWAPKTLRAGQGAQFLLGIAEVDDPATVLQQYRGAVIVTRLDATTSLYDAPLAGPVAWVFGSEGRGVSDAVAVAATCAVRIPMPGATESLNVSAAAAVCLFEMVRRRAAGR